MGVYVKGMNMPQSCITCRMECIARIHDSTKRSKDCPLVSVPTPHGRLIDADELQKKFDLAQKSLEQHGQEFSDAFISSSQEISTEWWAVEQKLEDAKTVIESEE